MAVVTFGRSLNPKSILEGADVYFECHVKSNPPFYNITWRNNVRIIFSHRNILTLLELKVRKYHKHFFLPSINKTGSYKKSFLQYLHLFWPVWQSTAAVEPNLSLSQNTPITYIYCYTWTCMYMMMCQSSYSL